MTKTILSWDVGIVNLAYCLVEKTNNKEFKIKKWDIINLQERKRCEGKDRNNNDCTKKVIKYINIDGTDKYFCNTHAKSYITTQSSRFSQCNNNEKCVHINKNNKLCNRKAQMNIPSTQTKSSKSISYCKTHLKIYQTLKKIRPSKSSLQTLAKKLFAILDTVTEFKTMDEVLIENQPTLKNPTMKTIASLLFSYFILRGCDDVKFICPSNKLKVSKTANSKVKSQENERKIYKMTKELGIKFCKELIKKDKENTVFINKQKKQDDLCDAFLQCYHYMFCKEGVPLDISTILDKLVKEENKKTNKKTKNNDTDAIDLSNMI